MMIESEIESRRPKAARVLLAGLVRLERTTIDLEDVPAPWK